VNEDEWRRIPHPEAQLAYLGARASRRKLRLLGLACLDVFFPDVSNPTYRSSYEFVERSSENGVATTVRARRTLRAVSNEVRFAMFNLDSRDRFSMSPLEWADHLRLRHGLEAAFFMLDFLGPNQTPDPIASLLRDCELTLRVDSALRAGILDPTAEDGGASPSHEVALAAINAALECQSRLVRDIFGNPFRPLELDARWLTSTVVDLAHSIYDGRAFERMPLLGDALMDAGCDSDEIIQHCRGDGPHVRGCWVVDLNLRKS
jgi:hypothetical protein